MNSKTFIISLFLCLFGVSMQAQDTSEQKKTIITELQSGDSQSSGTVRVIAEPGINSLIGTPWKSSPTTSSEYLKIPGFRVQTFSGNNPRTSKDEAYRKERLIKDLLPDIKTYIEYRSPRWSLRVGDFRTREEAMVLMQELKQAFPEFGREMYTVKVEVVNIPVNNQD